MSESSPYRKTSYKKHYHNRNLKNPQFSFKKREPPKPANNKTDVYYNLEQLENLWNQGETVICVRALGAAIPRAINLCLQFQKDHFNNINLETSTDTVVLVDDLEPLTDEDDFETVTRKNSSICIKLVRNPLLPNREN